MAQSILDLILRTKKQGNAETEATSGLQKLGDAFEQLTGFSLSSAGAIKAGIQFTKEAVVETVNYNAQIRELTQITGLSAEEMSRLVQVGDDWGVTTEQITSAMTLAMKNGFSPTIDNLARLADEYINTEDKTEFAAKATEIFGRQWTTLVPLLAQGGDALREQTAAVADNLIATDDAIAASREYEVAVDGLTDAWIGFKMTIGNEVIPALTNLMDTMDGTNEAQVVLDEATRQLDLAYQMGSITIEQYTQYLDGLSQGVITATDVINILDMAEVLLTDDRRESITAMQDATATTGELQTATEALTGATEADNTVLDMAIQRLKDSNIGMADKIELEEQLKLLTGEVTAEEVALKDAVGYLTTQLQLGNITQDQYIALLQQLQADASLAKGIIEAVGYSIENLPDKKTIEVTVKTSYKGVPYGPEPGPGAPLPPGPDDPRPRPGKPGQMGTTVFAGMPVLWNEPVTGGELLIPAGNGYILNMRQAQEALAGAAGGRGGPSIAIYGDIVLQGVESSEDLLSALSELMV